MKNPSSVEALRRQVETERADSTSRPRYSDELKDAVLALLAAESGWSVTRLSEALGLAQSVVHRWARKRPRRKAPAKLKRVKVIASPPAATRTFVVEFVSGARIVDLTWDDVSMLVRGDR